MYSVYIYVYINRYNINIYVYMYIYVYIYAHILFNKVLLNEKWENNLFIYLF